MLLKLYLKRNALIEFHIFKSFRLKVFLVSYSMMREGGWVRPHSIRWIFDTLWVTKQSELGVDENKLRLLGWYWKTTSAVLGDNVGANETNIIWKWLLSHVVIFRWMAFVCVVHGVWSFACLYILRLVHLVHLVACPQVHKSKLNWGRLCPPTFPFMKGRFPCVRMVRLNSYSRNVLKTLVSPFGPFENPR